eukprot:4195354-Amphidinium_carterae.1
MLHDAKGMILAKIPCAPSVRDGIRGGSCKPGTSSFWPGYKMEEADMETPRLRRAFALNPSGLPRQQRNSAMHFSHSCSSGSQPGPGATTLDDARSGLEHCTH